MKKNINLLKARDFYFDIARNWNNWIRFFIILPPMIVALTYLPFFSSIAFIDNERDIIVGFISIVSFFVIHFIFEDKKNENLEISNAIREEYDCNVLEIPHNLFAYTIGDIETYKSKCKFVKDSYKYEIWYEEIFCDSQAKNTICSQLDNITYTYHVYKEFKWFINLILYSSLFISLLSLFFGVEVFILVLISLFNIMQYCIESHSRIDELIKRNYSLMTATRDFKDVLLHELDNDSTLLLRMLQDVIISNRNQSLFIPKIIRNKYLKEESAFYKDLNEIKAIYLDKKTLAIPSKAEDIDIFNLEETEVNTLKQIQKRLLEMIEKVAAVFEKRGITYTLDGGTLIGAVRSKDINNPVNRVHIKDGGFVFWDDDIDIAIPTTGGMLEKAKQAIIEELGYIYDVQDYNSDPYYSPRLSNFRIRDRKSCISEKDSKLYEQYKFRGLFIDVYAYTPILYNRIIDSMYRFLLIHPMYRLIKKTEEQYPAYANPSCKEEEIKLNRILNKFSSIKKKYLKLVDWYLSHANNDKYFVYSPNYIENLLTPGPYIKKEYLYGKRIKAQFESIEMPIPSEADKVLSSYYGEWYKSPFESIEQLKKEYGEDNWFDKNYFVVTVMKHIDHVDLQ